MPILPPGVHHVHVKDVVLKQNPGYPPQLAVSFADDTDGYLTWYCKLGNTKDGFKLAQFEYEADQFAAMGWEPGEHNFAFEELQDPTTSPIFGWEGDIRVKLYNGKSEFQWIETGASGGASQERIAPDAAKSFGDDLRAKLRAAGKAVAAPAAPAPRPMTTPKPTSPLGANIPGLDDAPF